MVGWREHLADIPAVVDGSRLDHQQRWKCAALCNTRVLYCNCAVSCGRHEAPFDEGPVPELISVIEAIRQPHSAEATVQHQSPFDGRNPRDLPIPTDQLSPSTIHTSLTSALHAPPPLLPFSPTLPLSSSLATHNTPNMSEQGRRDVVGPRVRREDGQSTCMTG
jgi:hypothetical protein